MKFYLRDRNPAMVEKWNLFFGKNEDFEINCGDIWDGPNADAIISPANSFGFMDGGIDHAYIQKFGQQLEDRLREHVRNRCHGELPVGQAVILSTFNKDIPFLISAPTMRVPTVVKTSVNAYLAFRAALIEIKKWNASNLIKIESVICPGLGIGIGQIPPFSCARQMFEAYKAIWLDQPILPMDCAEIFYNNQELTGWAPTELKVDGKTINSPRRKGE